LHNSFKNPVQEYALRRKAHFCCSQQEADVQQCVGGDTMTDETNVPQPTEVETEHKEKKPTHHEEEEQVSADKE
jgi:hypothetical protein